MSLLYMLDTDSVSYALRGVGNVGERLLQRQPSECCISSVTLAELRFGAAKRKSRKLTALIDAFVAGLQVAPFDARAATMFGVVAAGLVARGTPIGNFDTLIAAHARSLDVTLVTNNTKHFKQVAGLRLDNWSD